MAHAPYNCRDAIVDLIHACGPQEFNDLKRECNTQALDYTIETVLTALNALIADGTIEMQSNEADNDTYYELSDAFYNAVADYRTYRVAQQERRMNVKRIAKIELKLS